MMMDNLAITLVKIGRYPEAMALQQRALEIAQSTLGSDHPQVIRQRENQANARRRAEAVAGAAWLLQRADMTGWERQ